MTEINEKSSIDVCKELYVVYLYPHFNRKTFQVVFFLCSSCVLLAKRC